MKSPLLSVKGKISLSNLPNGANSITPSGLVKLISTNEWGEKFEPWIYTFSPGLKSSIRFPLISVLLRVGL